MRIRSTYISQSGYTMSEENTQTKESAPKTETASRSFNSKSYMLGYLDINTLQPLSMGQPVKDLQSLFLTANKMVGIASYQESLKNDGNGLAIWQGKDADDAELIHFMFPWGWEACDTNVLSERVAQMWSLDENGHPMDSKPQSSVEPKNTESNPQRGRGMLKLRGSDTDADGDMNAFKFDVIKSSQHLKVMLSMEYTEDQADLIVKNKDIILKANWFDSLVGASKWADTAALDIAKGMALNSQSADVYPAIETLLWLREIFDTCRADKIAGSYTDKDDKAVMLSMFLNYMGIESESKKLSTYFPLSPSLEKRFHSDMIRQAVVNANVFLLRTVANVLGTHDNPDATIQSLLSLPKDNQVSLYRAGINTAMDNIKIAISDFRNLWLDSCTRYSPAQLAPSRSEFDKGNEDAKNRYLMARIAPIDFRIDPVFIDVLLNQYTGEKAAKRPKP